MSRENPIKKAADSTIEGFGFLASVVYFMFGKPGDAFYAATVWPQEQKESNDKFWGLLQAYALMAWSFAATGAIVLGGKAVGGLFGGIGLYAPPI